MFLTDVVGVDPRLASFAALIGIVWDAVNDPIMGTLTDRVNTRWGRRRPFLLFASVPFGLAFVLLWWAPPWESQWALALHVTVAYVLSDTLQTMVSVPFYALTPELTPDYDERTEITAWRMFFNLLASLAVAIAAPEIVDAATAAGFTQQQGYLIVGSMFGFLGVLPFLAIFAKVRENPGAEREEVGLVETLQGAWRNVPFRYLALLYMLNWITFDLVGLMVPYFVTWQLAGGDLVAKTELFGVELAMESAMLGMLIIVALPALPLWTFLSAKVGKRTAYIVAMLSWAAMQVGFFFVGPGDVALGIGLAAVAGLGVAGAHVIPDAMVPDVVDVDELQTGKRNEGVYYGAKNLIRKVTGALAIFGALQVLGWTGYTPPDEAGAVVAQPESALLAIRLLTGPAGAVLLLGAILVALRYPLTKAKHDAVRAELEKR